LHSTILVVMGCVFVWVCWMTYRPGRKDRPVLVT
jgi:cbb3-type cytochrome oxidase subunit 3